MKKDLKSEKKSHIIKFKKQPIWLKCNFAGKYNNIKFRFNYYEYNSEEVEDVLNKFTFTWPGIIPDNKDFAEEGIKALFIKLRNSKNSTIDMKVIKDTITIEEEKKSQEKELDELVKEELEKFENVDKDVKKEITKEMDENLQKGY